MKFPEYESAARSQKDGSEVGQHIAKEVRSRHEDVERVGIPDQAIRHQVDIHHRVIHAVSVCSLLGDSRHSRLIEGTPDSFQTTVKSLRRSLASRAEAFRNRAASGSL